jgi:diadenylate cyclase
MLFITFQFIDALDILLVAFLLYQVYVIIKGTPAVNIFTGIFVIYVVWIIVRALDMKLFGSILSKFIDVGVIAIIIVFQQELRKFLLFVGTNEFINRNRLLKILFSGNTKKATTTFANINFKPIVAACFKMGESKTGALIVLCRNTDLKLYINTGDSIDAAVSERMLENIFFKNSPLHDGAVIISGNKIVAARCVLPVTEKEQFPAHYGMRHRAAVGISESTDAVALIVSEQTGAVSLSISGDIKPNLNPDQLISLLNREFNAN